VTLLDILLDDLVEELLWGVLATAVMTTILEGSQGLGLSRLSPPFLVGTFFTGVRSKAHVIGYVAYALGGWLFALVYLALFISIGRAGWWLGALFGAAHGVVLLVAILPLVPYVHPRMATDYDGPARSHRLEPPGFIGLNYGYRTPLAVLVAHSAYGAVLGLGAELGHLVPH
jgi:hypothetical protein